jgi:hypothetical protein
VQWLEQRAPSGRCVRVHCPYVFGN